MSNTAFISCANNPTEADENTRGSKLLDCSTEFIETWCMFILKCMYRMCSMYWKMPMSRVQCGRTYWCIKWEYPFTISLAADVSTASPWKLPFYFALFSIGKCRRQRMRQVLNEAFRAVHKHEWIKTSQLLCTIQETSSPHSERQPPVEGSSCLIVHGNILQLLGTTSDDRKYPD